MCVSTARESRRARSTALRGTRKPSHVAVHPPRVTGKANFLHNYPKENWQLTLRSTRPASFSAAAAWRASPADGGPAVFSAARTLISSLIRSMTRFIRAMISELCFACSASLLSSFSWRFCCLVWRFRHAEAAGKRRPIVIQQRNVTRPTLVMALATANIRGTNICGHATAYANHHGEMPAVRCCNMTQHADTPEHTWPTILTLTRRRSLLATF